MGEPSQPDLEQFWSTEDPPFSEAMARILKEYSGISDEKLIPHVKSVRDQAWKVFKYPCVGRYAFVVLYLPKVPHYHSLISRLQAGETLLDLGCGMGQEIRNIVTQGAPSGNVSGMDLQPHFIECGYELFRDRDRLATRFYTGDFFALDTTELKGQEFDMIDAIHFFHLFSRDEQFVALSNALSLLKRRSGSMLVGYQFGKEHPEVLLHSTGRSGQCFGHSGESWSQLVQEVASKLQVTVDVEAALHEHIKWFGPDFRWLSFCITIR